MIIENIRFNAINKNTSKLIGEESLSISLDSNQYYVKSDMILFEGDQRFQTKVLLTLTESWVPVRVEFNSEDNDVKTQIKFFENYASVKVTNRQIANPEFKVRVDSKDVFFIFPGAISLPYLWSRNLSNIKEPKTFQGISGGMANSRPISRKSGSTILEVKITINGSEDLVWIMVDATGSLLSGYTRNQNILINRID
jgi:hypothetical protein